MSNIWKRSLSLLMAVVMVVGMVPMSVFATEQEECAHVNVEYIDEPADCVWEGYYAEYCLDCDTYLHEELIPANGHSWEGDVCTACGETLAVEEPEEESAEEPEEEAVEEVVEEEPSEEVVVEEAGVTYAGINSNVDGIIFLDENRQSALESKLIKGGLREMILTAIDEHGSEEKVYYVDQNGTKRNVSNILDLYPLKDELKDKLTNSTTLEFVVGSSRKVSIELVKINEVSVEITMDSVIKSGVAPADLKGDIKAMLDAADVKVYYNGTSEIEWQDLPDEQCTYVVSNPDSITWPGKTESVKTNAGIYLEIKDSVDGKTVVSDSVNITLVDTTDVWNIKFISNGKLHASYNVINGENLPAVSTPKRTHYTFAGWDSDVVTNNITADATYTATWTPAMDNNGNGIADQEEYFSVVYIVDGEEYVRYNQKYNSKTKIAAAPADDGSFLTWVPATYDEDGNLVIDDNGLVDEKVTRDMIYVAKWLENDEIVVEYTLKRIGNTTQTWTNMTYKGKAIDQSIDEGDFTGWMHNGELFDFDQTVTEDMTDNGVLRLTGTVSNDFNGDGKLDGSAENPYTQYIFVENLKLNEDTGEFEWDETDNGDLFFYDDEKADADDLNAEENTIFDFFNDNKVHVAWAEVPYQRDDEDGYWEHIFLVPVFANDFNNNGIPDTEETATLTVSGNASVTVTDLTVNAGDKAGEGSAVASKMEGEGEFLFTAKKQEQILEEVKNNNPTILTIQPEFGYFVEAVYLNGKNVLESTDYDAERNVYTINLTERNETNQTAGVSMFAVRRSATAYTIEVQVLKNEIEFKSEAEVNEALKPGKTYTVEDVYNAVVKAPVYKNNGDSIIVEYVAREEGDVEVNTKVLRDRIVQRYGKMGEMLLKQANIPETVTLPLGEVRKSVDYVHTGMVKSAQQVFDSSLLNENISLETLTEILGSLGNMDDLYDQMGTLIDMEELYDKLDNEVDIRPFLYNEGDGSFEEHIYVTYKSNGPAVPGNKIFTFSDNRAASPLVISDKEFYYKGFKDADLVADAEGKVFLDGSYENCDAMTYEVSAYRAGDENTQPARTTFKLNILKREARVNVDSVIVDKHGDNDYDASPDVKIKNNEGNWVASTDPDVISVVAGLDLNKLDLDVALNGNPNAYLNNVEAKAWISLPGNLKSDLEELGADLSRTYKVSEIKGMLENAKELMDAYGITFNQINTIIRVLQKVEDYGIYNYADAALTMDVIFSDDVYPENPGVYLNMAVIADSNYVAPKGDKPEIELPDSIPEDMPYDIGTILIAPVVALPNRGGVQLTWNGLDENVFVEPSDGNAKALTVTYNGSPVEADVFYYGLDAEMKILSGTTAPTLPGVYLASTIYTAEENGSIRKLGSDTAVIVIGMTDVDLDVESKIVEFGDDAYYKPDVTVTDKQGNVVTDAAVTVISGTVGVDNDEDLGLEDVTANVNISFPETVHKYWKEFAEYVNAQNRVDVIALDPDMKTAYIDVDVFVEFVDWCDAKLNAALNAVDSRLGYLDKLNPYLDKIKNDQDYVDQVKNGYESIMKELKLVSSKLVEAAEEVEKKTPDNLLKITFKKWNDMKFHDKGVYFFYGIVTDPDYIPASNAGVMIIKAPDEAMVWLDTHTPYDGNEKKPEGWDTTERDSITMIVDKKSKEVNFLLDNHMKAVVEEFEKLTNKSLDGVKVSALYEKYDTGTTYAEKLVSLICDKIYDEAIVRIKNNTPGFVGDLADDVLKKVDTKLGILRDKLDAKMLELKNLDVTIQIEDDLPIEVGTYEFYSYNYSIEVAYAELVIEPTYVRIAAPDLTKEYDGKGVNDLTPVISYYSYNYLEGQAPKEVEVPKPAGLTVNYKFVCLDKIGTEGDWAVGEYPITIEAADINAANVNKTVDVVDGKLTIVPRVVEVAVPDAEKFYGDADPAFEPKFLNGTSEVKKGDLDLVVSREQGEDVGEYTLTVTDKNNNSNYTVKTVDAQGYGTLTIKKAEIEITIESFDKCFDETDPEYKYTYKVINGLSIFTEEEIRDYIEKTLKLEIKRADGDDGVDEAGEEIELVADYVNDDKNVAIITVVPGKIVNTLGDYICWNTETKVYYTDVTDALKAAKSGQTIQMLKDATADLNGKDEETIIVYNGLTFDLNGFYVETDNLLSFGVVMDSLSGTDSVVNDDGLVSGGILIDVDTKNAWTQLQEANGDYIPVYDTVTGSYKFFKELAADKLETADGIVIDSYDIKDSESDSEKVKFRFDLLFDNWEAYYVLNRTENSGLTVVLDIWWTGIVGFNITYTMSDGTVKNNAGSQYKYQDWKSHMGLTVLGLQNIGSGSTISAVPRIETLATVSANAVENTPAQVYSIP